MADSLDALLDEVEAKFCREISLSSCTFKAEQDSHRQQRNNDSVHSKPKCSFTASISNPHEVEEIDNNIEAVLQEILDDDYPGSSSHRPVLSKTCAMESCPQTALKNRCCPVYLGGSSVASGVGTSVTQRACDQLRCTSCDFLVVMFDDHEWDSSCDYLFFRNNMPDCTKLRVKLKRRQGARAYACQCSWHSAFTLSELRHIPKLKWVCGQHTAS
ncbi:cilia- and flagella-associated protein 418 isoform X1 [Pangasianodon hypophthalmus]|uniref:cilia- and flagella-associated protein 418 isoform X1 n=1 Tax=Pangasianodon hypophthalmus TaxID=310915 RepID=UPI000F00B4B4|nr:cilia- and flagella-associated protein 418 isoform X1 [Pangasianodon hypophthalmus]